MVRPVQSVMGAHPRSRGENLVFGGHIIDRRGSSPLTRGKPVEAQLRVSDGGLIPAHAGKTRRTAGGCCAAGAHPRSRGENLGQGAPPARRQGSSPLTRGKPLRVRGTRDDQRLIPAHAGKTDARDGYAARRRLIPAHAGKTVCTARGLDRRGAHPRSRGENRRSHPCRIRASGSSPLTRGKLRNTCNGPTRVGLIPAHAGKTVQVIAHA